MRTLNELYHILWNYIKDKKDIEYLCDEIFKLYYHVDLISNVEYILLINHFRTQKPNEKQHTEFLQSKNWKGSNSWWSAKERYNPINRKLFIQKMIKITKQ